MEVSDSMVKNDVKISIKNNLKIFARGDLEEAKEVGRELGEPEAGHARMGQLYSPARTPLPETIRWYSVIGMEARLTQASRSKAE